MSLIYLIFHKDLLIKKFSKLLKLQILHAQILLSSSIWNIKSSALQK